MSYSGFPEDEAPLLNDRAIALIAAALQGGFPQCTSNNPISSEEYFKQLKRLVEEVTKLVSP